MPFGSKGGASQLPFMTLGEWTTTALKSKGLLYSSFDQVFNKA